MGSRAIILKQVQAVIDERTTIICLSAHGSVAGLPNPVLSDETAVPDGYFITLNGAFEEPPFHVNCRSILVEFVAGFVDEARKEANAELQRRPYDQRRLGPNGEIGGRLPPPDPDNWPAPGTSPWGDAPPGALSRGLEPGGDGGGSSAGREALFSPSATREDYPGPTFRAAQIEAVQSAVARMGDTHPWMALANEARIPGAPRILVKAIPDSITYDGYRGFFMRDRPTNLFLSTDLGPSMVRSVTWHESAHWLDYVMVDRGEIPISMSEMASAGRASLGVFRDETHREVFRAMDRFNRTARNTEGWRAMRRSETYAATSPYRTLPSETWARSYDQYMVERFGTANERRLVDLSAQMGGDSEYLAPYGSQDWANVRDAVQDVVDKANTYFEGLA